MTTETERKQRTVTLTDRAPVRIVEAEWPIIASARRHDGGEHEFEANRRTGITVRENRDGRRLVYAVHTSQWGGDPDLRAGYLIEAPEGVEPSDVHMVIGDDAATIRALHDVADAIGCPDMAAEVIGDLPAEELA